MQIRHLKSHFKALTFANFVSRFGRKMDFRSAEILSVDNFGVEKGRFYEKRVFGARTRETEMANQ